MAPSGIRDHASPEVERIDITTIEYVGYPNETYPKREQLASAIPYS